MADRCCVAVVDVSYQCRVDVVSYYNVLKTNFTTTDTIPHFVIQFKNSVKQSEVDAEIEKYKKWLQSKLKNEKVVVESK